MQSIAGTFHERCCWADGETQDLHSLQVSVLVTGPQGSREETRLFRETQMAQHRPPALGRWGSARGGALGSTGREGQRQGNTLSCARVCSLKPRFWREVKTKPTTHLCGPHFLPQGVFPT